MQILKIDSEKPDSEIIEKSARILKLGGIIVYPTETLYGLGANILDAGSIERVFNIKGRERKKPISILFSSVEQAKKYVYFNKNACKLADFFLPGGITMILPAKVPLGKLFGGDNIAIRVSSNKVIQELMKRLKFPITSTSANISGKPDPYSAEESINQIGDKVDLVLDAGECEHGKPSTIIEIIDEKVNIIREGAIPKKRIINYIKY